ncbi:unnamed protein product [Closterium sp. NIES-53]
MARRGPFTTRRGPFATRRSPPLPPVAGPLPPVVACPPPVAASAQPPPFCGHCPAAAPCRGSAFAACRGLCPAAAPCRGHCPAAAQVAAMPSLSIAASALQTPPVAAMSSPPSRPLPCSRTSPTLRHLLPRCAASPQAAPPCRAAPPSRAAPPAELRRPTEPHCPACSDPTATAASAATAATAAPAATAAMASPTILTFDAEGRAVDFDVWVDDLQLFLQCDSRDGLSLFDHTSNVSTTPATTDDSTVRSQWTTRDAVARLAVCSHLPPAQRAHFGQYKTAKSLYDAVVARYSSPATAALSRLMLPYLFPDLTAFATVANLITHLRTSDARYRAALPTEFCAKNPSPLYITLYYLVTCRPGLSLYTRTTASPPVSASGQVAASNQVFAAASRSSPAAAPCSCRPLSHETLLWHHRLGHPSLPRLRGMASRTLVSGLPRSLPPLPPGLGHERYFLLVVDDYSDRGGEFSSDLLRAFCRAEGIRQTFTLLASPQQNGIAEHRIGMVMDVARTSMIHAAAPHFLWPFAIQYAAHQINLQPRVSLPETTPTLRWTGKVGDASAFRFYHPTSRRIPSSQDVTFDESVSYYYSAEPLEVAVDSGAARGAEPVGAGTGGVEPGGAELVGEGTGGVEPGGAEPERVESGGAEPARVEPGGAEPTCAESGRSPCVPLRQEPLSPQWLREWYTRRCPRATSGARAAGGAAHAEAAGGAAGAGATRGAAGAGATGGAVGAKATRGAAGAGATRGAAGGTAGAGAVRGAAGAGAAGAAGPGGAGTGGTRAAGAGGATDVKNAGTGAGGAAGVVTGDPGAEGTSAVFALQPSSPLPGPSPFSGPTRGLTERHEPESRPVSPVSRSVSPVHTARAHRRVSHPRPPPVPGTHSMTLLPSTVPQRVPLPSPPASSLPDGPNPESDSLRAASPTVTRILAIAVTNPLFESTAASALVAGLVNFAAACRLDYATSLVAESASAGVCPPSVGGECALCTDVVEDRQQELECFAAAVPHVVSTLLVPERDPTPRSDVEAITEPLGVVSTMAGPEERGGRVAGGSGEAQAQGQPRDSAMAPMQPSLGPPRDEPRVFGLDKFNGDNFAE